MENDGKLFYRNQFTRVKEELEEQEDPYVPDALRSEREFHGRADDADIQRGNPECDGRGLLPMKIQRTYFLVFVDLLPECDRHGFLTLYERIK